MAYLLLPIFYTGAVITYLIPGYGLFALVGAFIALDVWLGLRRGYRSALIFSIVQVIGVLLGFLWTVYVSRQQDVAGPFAWMFVISVWGLSTILFHLWLVYQIWFRPALRHGANRKM